MIIPDDDVKTQEVKNWRGLHLLHYQSSSCSQKVRILLREKGLNWTSHPINIAKQEHITARYLGINPRGVVPALVHDGRVHVESNDMAAYIDGLPSETPAMYPVDSALRRRVDQSLEKEQSLHLDLRTITMRFLLPPFVTRKSETTLHRYETYGPSDGHREQEIRWWRSFRNVGISDDAARSSVAAHREVFERFDDQLSRTPWLLGDQISVLEAAWFIRTKRLAMAGYPLKIHPHLFAWHERLQTRPAFREETKDVYAMRLLAPLYQFYLRRRGQSMTDVAPLT